MPPAQRVAAARAQIGDVRAGAGAEIRTRAMVTAINADNSVDATTPDGLVTIAPRALIVATGARERPRPARLIPGDRTAGVYTTGHLQNLVHVHHQPVGKRAVIAGAAIASASDNAPSTSTGTRTRAA